MSTNSLIAMKTDDGYRTIYCHWDGYPEHNGKTLVQHYSDPEKVEALIALGDISSLASEIGEKHDFNDRESGTTSYHRDRGEDWSRVEPRNYDSVKRICRADCTQEYVYVFEDGDWRCWKAGRYLAADKRYRPVQGSEIPLDKYRLASAS